MKLARHHGGGAILFTFIVALLLTIMPLPEWARYLRPDWVGLVLIYWCMAVPERVGVGSGWFAGLLLDTLTGTLLGQHAAGLALVAYLSIRTHQRVRLNPVWQQALTVLLFLFIHQLVTLWVHSSIGLPHPGWRYWLTPFIGALLWPPTQGILRALQTSFAVR
jgi:rod shape-determining protein MreD